ncbi:hypothetical protein [Georgfuchsia toluolica]|nr:hypothetical protein [Georgfuchsia toluolica]
MWKYLHRHLARHALAESDAHGAGHVRVESCLIAKTLLEMG